jgi:two-component system sensor histidine kinase KdpD
LLASVRGRGASPGPAAATWTRGSVNALDRWPTNLNRPSRFVSATVLVAMASGTSWLLQPLLQVGSLILPFLIAIMLTAIAFGLLPALLASVLSVLTFDFLFLPPLYSLSVAEPDDVARLVIFGLTALIVSNLAAYARSQAVSASRRAAVAEDLYRFGRELAGAATLLEVMDVSLPRLRAMLGAPVLIGVRDGDVVRTYPEQPRRQVTPAVSPLGAPPGLAGGISGGQVIPGTEFARGTEFAHITPCVESLTESWLRQESGSGSDFHPPALPRWMFVPMRTGRGKVGIMAIGRDALDNLHDPMSEPLFGTLADLMAQAIDRIALVDDLNRASRAAEREELHATLLASLSHDLRTPLASVLVAAESLIAQPDVPGAETQQSLARSIQGEARRLDRYISSLLDMTRIETGLAVETSSRLDLADAVSVALDRGAKNLHRHRLNVELAADLPLLGGDEVLLEHVLFNLLDNAAKYSPPGSTIELRAFRDADDVVIEVTDEGDGIAPAELERIFEKFYRAERPGRASPGIGLGLSICRGYIEAMGGHITARNRSDGGGAAFVITLPVPEMEELPDLDT